MNSSLESIVDQLTAFLTQKNIRMSSAESLTAGMISVVMTDRAGSSAWWDSSYVVYNNTAKTRMLGVSASLLQANGAVDELVVEQMAVGALQKSSAAVSVAITGIAGPGGAEEDKPVGTVWIGVARYNKDGWIDTQMRRYTFDGDRQAIRLAAVEQALTQTLCFLRHAYENEVPNSTPSSA